LTISPGNDKRNNDSQRWLVEAYARFKKFPFSVMHDPEEKIEKLYGVGAFPTLFIIDKKGVVRYKIEGFHKDKVEGYKKITEELLAE